MPSTKNTKSINRSFDTETVDGNVVILADSDGRYLHNPSVSESLKFISHRLKVNNKYVTSRWFLYNLRYDMDSIMKGLSLQQISEFYKTTKTEHEGIIIRQLIPNVVSVGRDEKHRNMIYDINQFYNGGKLDDMGKKYVGMEKCKDEIIESFKTTNNNMEYFDDHKDLLTQYCIQDAKITKALADKFETTCNSNGYDFSKPGSWGSLTTKFYKPYLNEPGTTNDIPRIFNQPGADRRTEEYFEIISSGGWNDCFKRGIFEDVIDLDVSGCYSNAGNMAPYWAGTWIMTDKETDVMNPEFVYGLVTCNIRNLRKPIIPKKMPYFNSTFLKDEEIKFKSSLTINCVGSEKDVLLTLERYRFLRDMGFCDLELIQAQLMKPSYPNRYMLVEPNNIVIGRKKEAEKLYGKESLERHTHKYIANPITGKFKQKHHSDFTWFYQPHLYNFITWKCKEKVIKEIEKNDLWDSLISVSTDGFAYQGSKIDFDVKSWTSLKAEKWVQIGNGIYYYRSGDKYEQRLRGFKLNNKINIEEQLLNPGNASNQIIPLKQNRPLHLKECFKLTKTRTISDVNKFVDITKKLDINKEIKRKWNDKFKDINEILNGKLLKSEPHTFREADLIISKNKKSMQKQKIINPGLSTLFEDDGED